MFNMSGTVTLDRDSVHPRVSDSARASHRYVDLEDARLHLLDFGGAGRPIVLLHGVGGSAWTWLEVGPALTDAGLVLALDFRGFGESQWSPTQEYTTAAHATDVGRVLDALGLGEIDVVGFSWGGLVGLALAAESERVRRLAIVDISPSFERSETDIPSLGYSFADGQAAVAAERRLSPTAADSTLVSYAALATHPGQGGQLVKKHDEVFLYRWPFRTDDHWGTLRRLDRPILVVRGGLSPVLSAKVAGQMIAVAHDARLVQIPGCGHMIPIERPAELAVVLKKFLA